MIALLNVLLSVFFVCYININKKMNSFHRLMKGLQLCMFGQFNGLETLVRSKCEHSIFVHCYVQKINLVLIQSVDYIKTFFIAFFDLSSLHQYFMRDIAKKYLSFTIEPFIKYEK